MMIGLRWGKTSMGGLKVATKRKKIRYVRLKLQLQGTLSYPKVATFIRTY